METTKQQVVGHYLGYTKSKLCNIKFTWVINNFSFLQENNGECIESPIFSLDENNGIKWSVQLYPNGINENCKDNLSLFLKLIPNSVKQSKVFAKFNISVMNAESKEIITKISTVAFNFAADFNRGWHNFTKRAFILDEANGCLPDDELTIFCEVTYVCNTFDISSQKVFGKVKVPECKISDDFGKLLDSHKLSDVTLVVGEHEFPAHKAILAARSDVFAAMFDYTMEESKSGRVIIDDINQEVIEEMLHFIYTGESPKIKEMANHLLAVADKYALNKLKAMSEKALLDEVSIETAAEILILADLHSAKQLKEQTIQFINIHAKDIIKTEGFASMHSTLIAEAFGVNNATPSKEELPTS